MFVQKADAHLAIKTFFATSCLIFKVVGRAHAKHPGSGMSHCEVLISLVECRRCVIAACFVGETQGTKDRVRDHPCIFKHESETLFGEGDRLFDVQLQSAFSIHYQFPEVVGINCVFLRKIQNTLQLANL